MFLSDDASLSSLVLTPCSPKSFLRPALAFPCPCSFAVCSDYSFAKGMIVSTVSAVFAPAVPPHSGCFIQKTWTSSLCLTSVCFHSTSVSKLLHTFCVRTDKIVRTGLNDTVTFVFFFLSCFSPNAFILFLDEKNISFPFYRNYARLLMHWISEFAALYFEKNSPERHI